MSKRPNIQAASLRFRLLQSVWGFLLPVLALCLSLAGCSPSGETQNQAPEGNGASLRIVATTGMLADAARAIAGDLASVEALMGPGIDPHYYKATQGDVGKLRGADLVVHNGLHLEGRMQEVLEALRREKPVFALTDGLDQASLRLVGDANQANVYDPHVWFDVRLWSQGIEYLAGAFGQAFPEHNKAFQNNAAAYRDTLERLDQHLREAYGTVPKQNRILVTSHDAFSYFGKAYGFEVRGLQGVSTVTEVSLRDLANLVDTMVERQIPAVFVESSVSPRTIQSLVEGCKQKGWTIAIGGELFSDAMGDAGTFEGRYTGMLEHNARLIVEGLGGLWPEQADVPPVGQDADGPDRANQDAENQEAANPNATTRSENAAKAASNPQP